MEKELKVIAAPDPTNINWLNLDSSKTNKVFRRLLSIFLTICLLIASKQKKLHIKFK